jgi:predicted ATP-grasp superfamily ATP-dependent carboligase
LAFYDGAETDTRRQPVARRALLFESRLNDVSPSDVDVNNRVFNLRIFVTEYVCGGGWPRDELVGSLAVEGRAMLEAIVEDLSKISGVHVVTTWDSRLGPHPFRNVEVICVEEPEASPAFPEGRQFLSLRLKYVQTVERLSLGCDATLLIAPEFDRILLDLCRRVETIGGKLLSPGSEAVQLCADKLKLAALLKKAGVHTIPTKRLSWSDASPLEASDHVLHFPLVIKPRDGAGSQDNHLVRSWDEFERLRFFLSAHARSHRYIWQPFIAGQPVSVGLMALDSGAVEPFPVAEQLLSDDGRFFYRGGRIPARDVDQASVQAAALAASGCVQDLRGFAGVDLIVPTDVRSRPIVVEINPRLTTSYLGYRALAKENLAEWMLPGCKYRLIEWRRGEVEFDAGGSIGL